MDAADVLERLPAMAEAVQQSHQAGNEVDGRHWRLVAFDPGMPGRAEAHLQTFAQCRSLALDLSELGCVVKVCDGEGHVRLWMWPPQHV
jgi:hypothetical protein